MIAAAAVGWSVVRHERLMPAPAQLVRVSPDDGYSYTQPTISPDGKFVAAVSDRSGTPQLWLQQVGGGDPIQVTHSAGSVLGAQFFPDGTRLLVWTVGGGNKAFEIVPTLGGQAHLLVSGNLDRPALSPDGRQVAYVEWSGGRSRLAVISVEGGIPRAIEKWGLTQGQFTASWCSWTADGQTLIVLGNKRRDAPNLDDWDAFALPLDGGDPVALGVGDALRATGFELNGALLAGNRLLVSAVRNRHSNVWQLQFTPGSWRVKGPPRQLTFGTENEVPVSASESGTIAIQTSIDSSNLYMLPVDPNSGDASGMIGRLTRDGRMKVLWAVGGRSRNTLFFRAGMERSRPHSLALFAGSGHGATEANRTRARSRSESRRLAGRPADRLLAARWKCFFHQHRGR